MGINVIINGAKGRMGQHAVRYLGETADINVIAQAGRSDDLATLIKQHQTDVVLDLTVAGAAFDNASIIIETGTRPVIGTTGLTHEQIIELTQRCAKQSLGGVIAPNFSISALLMMQFSSQAAKVLPYVEIVEYHHENKKDAPSGTATKTATMISQARNERGEKPIDNTETQLYPGCRGGDCDGVAIHSVRMPGFLATQEVVLGNAGETLSIRHSSISRDAFMPGVALACRGVMTLNELVYGLEHLL